MTPLYSDTDKAVAIRKFMYARSMGQSGINSYEGIQQSIAAERIELLHAVPKSGSYQANYSSKTTYYYTEGDAQVYFEWLMSAVAGTEEVSEEVSKKAINQIFKFLFTVAGTLSNRAQTELLTPYSLDEEIKEVTQKISEVEKKVDYMNGKILDALERIGNWQKTYQSCLDELKREHQERKKIAKSLETGKNDGKKRDS